MLLVMTTLLAPIGLAGAQNAPSGGTGTLYVGTYARNVLVLDEGTMKVRDTI